MVRIRFKSDEDYVNGFYCLALNGRARCLPNRLFEVQRHMLMHLDREGIRYAIVGEEALR